jgi:esterase/lipase
MPYILEAYAPVEVIRLRDDADGRTWVIRATEPKREFWVGTQQVYDTEEACIRGSKETLKSGIKQMEYEAKQNMKRVEAAKKMLHSVSPAARIEELERLLKCVYHNLETIKHSCEIDRCTAGQVLSKESLEWIETHNIPNLDK